MTSTINNHPKRSQNRYYEVSPRGFVNETTYIIVRDSEVAAVEKHFDGYVDKAFDAGQTGAICGWTDSKRARAPGVAISWDEYRSYYL